jgi:hypothetical protein
MTDNVLNLLIQDKAKFFGLDVNFIRAMVKAEGGAEAFVKAVQCSVKTCKTLEKAIEIACRSVAHRAFEYAVSPKLQKAGTFTEYLGSKWAPIGADNDPTGLNNNWVKNVVFWYVKYQDDPKEA